MPDDNNITKAQLAEFRREIVNAFQENQKAGEIAQKIDNVHRAVDSVRNDIRDIYEYTRGIDKRLHCVESKVDVQEVKHNDLEDRFKIRINYCDGESQKKSDNAMSIKLVIFTNALAFGAGLLLMMVKG